MDPAALWYSCQYLLEHHDVRPSPSQYLLSSTGESANTSPSLITLFLYMVSELSVIQQIVTTLTGLNGLPVVIVECVVTTIYTALGGFKVSFITDNIQGALVLALIIIACISVGATTSIDRSAIDSSGLLGSSLLGWQLIYILPVAILTNDFFLSGFWLRTFASKTDRDLWIGTGLATIAVTIILILVGVTGLIAAWSGAWDGNADTGSLSFFLLMEQLPAWVVGVVLAMCVCLSTAAFDSLQSGMVSTGSNDLFRNKLNLWVIKGAVVLICIPVIVVALRSPNILQIYLISDLVSAALVPVLCIGLVERFYLWTGFEVVVGGLGGLLSVFIFGLIYLGNAKDAGNLLLLENGLYNDDWSAFGAFVAAPVGGLLFALGALVLRLGFLYVYARVRGRQFTALDRPVVHQKPTLWTGDALGAALNKDDEGAVGLSRDESYGYGQEGEFGVGRETVQPGKISGIDEGAVGNGKGAKWRRIVKM